MHAPSCPRRGWRIGGRSRRRRQRRGRPSGGPTDTHTIELAWQIVRDVRAASDGDLRSPPWRTLERSVGLPGRDSVEGGARGERSFSNWGTGEVYRGCLWCLELALKTQWAWLGALLCPKVRFGSFSAGAFGAAEDRARSVSDWPHLSTRACDFASPTSTPTHSRRLVPQESTV